MVAISIALTGCATVAPVTLTKTFDENAAKRMLEKGTNTIRGSALIRQRAGGVVTCAGRSVHLIPATDYATERVMTIYGNAERGFHSAGFGSKKITFNESPAEYWRQSRQTICDAQGFFKFENISDNAFFITTNIVWKLNDYFLEGGALIQRVAVQGGEIREIVLSP